MIRFKFILLFCLFFIVGKLAFAQAPNITSFLPQVGPPGTLVTVNGTNLGNPTAFSIGGVPAIVISNTGTKLVGYVMPGATTGAIAITTALGTANGPGNFTVTATPYPTVQQGNKLVGNDYAFSARQGSAVAISADGNTAVVGGNVDNNLGAAWVYVRSGGVWTQQGPKLVGTGIIGNNPPEQGCSVAINADGNTIIVGGQKDNNGVGAAWVYSRSNGVWTQQTKLVANNSIGSAWQGNVVALSADGNTALVSAYNDNGSFGAAWVYTRTAGVWAQQSKLVGTPTVYTSAIGFGAALSADGNTVILGGIYDNAGIGSVWIFARSAGVWTQEAVPLAGGGNVGQAYQGYSVALSADGNTAMVGGWEDNSDVGAVWIFTRNGKTWTQQGNKLVGAGYNGTARQGSSVSLSADGNTAVFGGLFDNANQGSFWVFTRANGVWTQRGPRLQGTNAAGGSPYQGSSIALSADGYTMIEGGTGDNSSIGASWVFISLPVPVVTTTAATNIAASTTTLNGIVNDNGSTATVSFEYSTTANLQGAAVVTTTTGTNPIPANTGSNVSFTAALTGLNPNTKYYYRINANSANGASQGDILSFTTLNAQTITFPVFGTTVYGAPDIIAPASSTNNVNPVSYTSSNTAVAIVIGGTLHITGVGTTVITASQAAVSGYAAANPVSQTLTVLKAPLTIIADDKSKTYGASNPALTITFSGLVYGETNAILSQQPSISTVADNSSVVGTYAIILGGASAVNYDISYTTGTLTVTPAVLTVTADNKTRAYGSANPVLTVTYSGFVNGQNAGVLLNGPLVTTTATVASGVNSYPITATGAAAANYTFTYVPGSLTVSAAPLTITADNKTRPFGSADPVFTGTYAGFVNGETPAVITTTPVYSTTATLSSPMGNYPITGSGAVAANYVITYVPGVLTITMGTRTLSFGALPTKTYGDADFAPGATITSGEPISYTSSNTSVATIVNGQIHVVGAGVATITATAPPNNNANAVAPISQVLTVNKASQTINFAPIANHVKGDADITLTITASSGLAVILTSADPTVAMVTGMAVKFVGAGITILTATQAGNSNYLPATATQTLTVLAAPLQPVAPNTFTPNGDGFNDTWVIQNLETFTDCNVSVYNRYGKLVFSSIGYATAWDGKLDGSPLPVGTYYYVIDLKHKRSLISGVVNLIR